MIETITHNFATYFPEINRALGAGILIFARVATFLKYAPVFNRKEFPTMVKLSFALIFTIVLSTVIPIQQIPSGTSLTIAIVLNMAFGAIIGWVADVIMRAIEAGGDMINMQMGLSSAMVLDPSSGAQTSVMGKFIALLGVIIFINIGGIYWLINAFVRSFEIFPMWNQAIPIMQAINQEYLVTITSNVFFIGLQIASPVLLATLAQDIILGIISKTAPQVNVFQLSFLFKPVLGAAILIWIAPMLLNVIEEYFNSFANIL